MTRIPLQRSAGKKGCSHTQGLLERSPVRAPWTQNLALAFSCRLAQPAAPSVGIVRPLCPPLDPAPTHVNTKKRVLEPTNSAAAVATGMYLAGLRRVPGLRGILGAAPPHPSPGRAGGAGRVGPGSGARAGRGAGFAAAAAEEIPPHGRRRRADVSAPLKVDPAAGPLRGRAEGGALGGRLLFCRLARHSTHTPRPSGPAGLWEARIFCLQP